MILALDVQITATKMYLFIFLLKNKNTCVFFNKLTDKTVRINLYKTVTRKETFMDCIHNTERLADLTEIPTM